MAEATTKQTFTDVGKGVTAGSLKDSDVSDDEQLILYGLFKLGQNATVAKPGMFNIREKYKYEAWKELADLGMTPEQAQEEYIRFVEVLKTAEKPKPLKDDEEDDKNPRRDYKKKLIAKYQ